jgi:hypothetical protein
MNTISYESGNAIIPFNGVPIRIGNRIYKNITAVVRLLSAPEIIRLDKMRMSNSYDEEVINDDIVKLCLIDIIGVEGEINLDETSAGFVTTLAKSIYLYSIDPLPEDLEPQLDLITPETSRASDGLATPFEGTRTSDGGQNDNDGNLDNAA